MIQAKNARIFISYSHHGNGPQWKAALLREVDVFERHYLLDVWHDGRIRDGSLWNDDIRQALADARLAVVLLTKEALESEYILDVEFPALRERQKDDNLLVFPIVCEPCDWRKHDWLSATQIPNSSNPLSGLNPEHQHHVFRQLANDIAEKLSQAALNGLPIPNEPPPPDRIYLDKFPLSRTAVPYEEKLIGREQELALLNLAFAQPHTAIGSLVAWGGVGKTMLVQHWLQRLQRGGWFGARRVYGWSFYSQGTSEDRQASEDSFLAHALAWFGVQCEPTLSAWDKGRLLADAVARECTLLILDGIEPLQYPPGPMGGQLRAPGVQSLLKQLARNSNNTEYHGLCLVTTREPLTDLSNFLRRPDAPWGSVLRVGLGNLTEEAGAKLLHHAGATRAGAAEIKADDAELLTASTEVDGHALTLNLLGRFLARAHRGDIRRRDLVKFEEADRKEQGGTTFKMLTAFENWFAKSGEFGARQLAVLQILALFDRPGDAGCIGVLRDPPVIIGLTEPLFTSRISALTHTSLEPLVDEDWNTLVSFLLDFSLLVIQTSSHDQGQLLDCHPLIREHFAKQLRQQAPAAWESGHHRLFAHLSATAMEYPGTIEEMEPLYQSVLHSCKAGHHQHALDEVYYRRIQRGEAGFNIDTLGAIEADLAMLAGFFEKPWTMPVKTLTEPDRTFVTGQAAFRLTFLGRLQEALEPAHLLVQQRIEQAEQRKDERAWNNATYSAGNLSIIYSSLGDLPNALKYAEQSVILGEMGAAYWQRSMAFAGRAEVHHFAGRNSEAAADFVRAEAAARKQGLPFLSSVQGLRYCCFLTDQRQHDQAILRAQAIISEGRAMGWAVDVGWGHLILAEAKMRRDDQTSGQELRAAADHCDMAMRWLQVSGVEDQMISCLLMRAELRHANNDFSGELTDLDEASARATRCGMQLLLVDCDLGYSRYYLANGQLARARERLHKAKTMIGEIGYHRRDGDLALIERRLSLL